MKKNTGCAKPERRQAEARSSTVISSPAVKGRVVVPRKPLLPPDRVIRKSALSPARQRLVEIMQELGYGRVKYLVIAGGEPIMDPPPRVYRHQRLTGPNTVRGEARLTDFILKQQLVRLFEAFDRLGNGAIASLEIRDGLPYGIALEEPGRK